MKSSKVPFVCSCVVSLPWSRKS